MPVAGRHGVFQAGRQGMQGRMALGRLISWRRPGSAFTPALKVAATVDRVAQARVAAAGRPNRAPGLWPSSSSSRGVIAGGGASGAAGRFAVHGAGMLQSQWIPCVT